MLRVPPDTFTVETDQLLERLEQLLLSGLRRLPRHYPEHALLETVIEHSGCSDLAVPERLPDAHELVLTLQEKVFPRPRRPLTRGGESLACVLG